jgi:hypothetical protein
VLHRPTPRQPDEPGTGTVTDTRPQAGPPLDMRLYERLIDDGLADADRHGGAVDHLTARRLAVWLNARPQQPDFAQGLDQFIQTGAVSRQLRTQLRTRARSANYSHRSQVFRLVQYSASRGPDLGPLGPDFGRACDEIDRADAMLTGLRDRIRQGTARQPKPDTDAPKVTAQTSWDAGTRTVTLSMDEATASLAIYAVAANAAEREAHVREVEQFGRGLPEGSYGRQNRQAIAARETRAAHRLRAMERAYQIALGRAAGATAEPVITRTDAEQAVDREMELE